jgi:YidC/Oxa1 family membrane protein insertase
MDFDKRTILAFLLIGLILILAQTPLYQKLFFPQIYKAREAQKQQQAEMVTQEANTTPENNVLLNNPISPHTTRNDTVLQKATVSQQTAPEKFVKVEGKLYKAVLSSKGASLLQWTFKNFSGPDGKPVQNLPPDAYGTFGLSFLTKSGDTLETSQWMFQTDSDDSVVFSDETTQSITFTYNIDENKKIIKEFVFNNDSYDFIIKVKFENMQDFITDKMYFISAPHGLLSSEKNFIDDMMFSKAGISASGNVDKGFKSNNKLNKISGDIDWIGVRTKYFALAIIPLTHKGTSAQIIGREISTEKSSRIKWKKFSIRLIMPFFGNEKAIDEFKIYCGPLDYDILKKYQINLEEFMDFGWKIIKPFSLAILWSFKKIHTVIPNYGFVLIIFSILIKIILAPFTYKSSASMNKMQKLQPRMSEIRDKFAKDPQRLNKETMKLYKEAGVNPLGSCLPMILQMPLLYALFTVFRSTIELRGEGFVAWIKDLSNPDSIALLPFTIPLYGNSVNVLPIIMGITMFIQQRMTTVDPKQKMMIYMMPVFFTLIFNSFPSGLTLYYTLFNILSILEQKWIKKMKSPEDNKI